MAATTRPPALRGQDWYYQFDENDRPTLDTVIETFNKALAENDDETLLFTRILMAQLYRESAQQHREQRDADREYEASQQAFVELMNARTAAARLNHCLSLGIVYREYALLLYQIGEHSQVEDKLRKAMEYHDTLVGLLTEQSGVSDSDRVAQEFAITMQAAQELGFDPGESTTAISGGGTATLPYLC